MSQTYDRYVASKRYDYVGIEEFDEEGHCLRTVITGIKPQKLGYRIANLLNEAYRNGSKNGEGL